MRGLYVRLRHIAVVETSRITELQEPQDQRVRHQLLLEIPSQARKRIRRSADAVIAKTEAAVQVFNRGET